MRRDPGNQPEAPSRSPAAPRRRLARRRCAVVLGITAAAALLAGCSKTSPAPSTTADGSAASANCPGEQQPLVPELVQRIE